MVVGKNVWTWAAARSRGYVVVVEVVGEVKEKTYCAVGRGGCI